MADQKPKLTPEELAKLKQIQQLIMKQGPGAPGGAAGAPGGLPPGFNIADLMGAAAGAGGGRDQPKPSLWERIRHLKPRTVMVAIVQTMNGWVKTVDQFIDLVVKKDASSADDVVKAARSPIVFGVFVTLFFFIFGVLWAGTAPLDSAAVAIGTVVSSSQKKVINHQEGGIIKNIYVKIGDTVKQGDKLIELDDTRIRSEYESILHQYRILMASEARLNSELNNEDGISWPQLLLDYKDDKDVAKILYTQNNLFESRKNIESAERAALKQKAKQLEKQIEGFVAKKVALKKNLEATKDRLDATKQLNVKGFVQKSSLLEMETKEANIASEIAITETEIVKAEQEITKNEMDLLNLDSKFSTQALTELKDAQSQLATARERYIYLKEALSRTVVRAPVSGIVNQLNYHTVGSNIPPSSPIVEISPNEDMLVIDAKVDPKNIDSIKVGLISKIRFSAFKSRTTPVFNGTVISISPDIIVDQQPRGPGDPLAMGYYLARIELDMTQFKEVASARKLELHPGMQAEVQIVTGTRTLLKYLLDPVYDAMFKGLKEK
jgi:HlyD family secretion protein